jgi:hypothetical protein
MRGIILKKDLSADYTDWRRVGESMLLIRISEQSGHGVYRQDGQDETGWGVSDSWVTTQSNKDIRCSVDAGGSVFLSV